LQARLDPEDLFTKQERIGKGSFGEVYKGIDRRTQKTIAIKIINLEEAEDEIEDIQQEITVLSQCDSSYITKYLGSYIKVSLNSRDLLYVNKSASTLVPGIIAPTLAAVRDGAQEAAIDRYLRRGCVKPAGQWTSLLLSAYWLSIDGRDRPTDGHPTVT